MAVAARLRSPRAGKLATPRCPPPHLADNSSFLMQVPILKMYGVTRQGNSVATFVHGFEPYFYVEVRWAPAEGGGHVCVGGWGGGDMLRGEGALQLAAYTLPFPPSLARPSGAARLHA